MLNLFSFRFPTKVSAIALLPLGPPGFSIQHKWLISAVSANILLQLFSQRRPMIVDHAAEINSIRILTFGKRLPKIIERVKSALEHDVLYLNFLQTSGYIGVSAPLPARTTGCIPFFCLSLD